MKIKADLQNTYAKTKINKLNRIAQFALKGTKDYYLIAFARNGIKDYDTNIAGGHRLELAPPKINNQTKDYQRIREGKNSIVLAANKREKINLNLNGNGAQGEIYIITPNKIKSYKYPNRNWHSVIEVDNSGSAIVKEGSKLVKESTSINNNVNENTNSHNPAQNEINNTSPSIGITGTWRSNFGNITFHQQGNTVTGTYTHDHGRLVGFLRGNILTGKWSEAPTYKPDHDAGAFELIFSPDRNSFTGHWRYGFKGNSWDGKWDGTFINDR